MFLCDACDKEFKNPLMYPADFEAWGISKTEYFGCCPYCGEPFIRRSVCQCEHCNDYIYDGEIYYQLKDGTEFCDRCISERRAKI